MKVTIILFLSLGIIFSNAQSNLRTEYFPKREIKSTKLPKKKNVWVFIMAGQSNMAGRGLVEPQDTVPNERILTINKKGEIIIAKEPLHFYEPNLTGLDCGASFANELLKSIPSNKTILIIPTAVGGSSISQWLGDSTHRNVKLMTNFKEKITLAKQYGTIKGIIWHQGESDSNPRDIPLYQNRLNQLFTAFRKIIGQPKLPIILGELGSYSNNAANWLKINEQIHSYVKSDPYSAYIETADFIDKGDKIHFNSAGQRTMGKRFATKYLQLKK